MNEVQVYSQNGQSQRSIHSPFVDINKVFQQPPDSNEKTVSMIQKFHPVDSATDKGTLQKTTTPFIKASGTKLKEIQEEISPVQDFKVASTIINASPLKQFTGQKQRDKNTEEKSNSATLDSPLKRLNKDHYLQTRSTIMNLHLIDKYYNEYKLKHPFYMPDSKHQRLLIFDIDETMIHTLDERDPPEMKGTVRLFIPDTEHPT